MGFNVILDILGSTIVAGIVMLTLFRVQDSAVENAINGSTELSAQQNLAVTVQLIEHDFRRIGYCKDWNKIPDTASVILHADSNKIKFLTDIESDGFVDTMYYYLGPASELLSTPNPRDRFLYRVVNSEEPVGVNLGVTQFNIKYFDVFSDSLSFPIAEPRLINLMQIDVAVEDVAAYNEEYSKIFWRQIRLAAKNLRNR